MEDEKIEDEDVPAPSHAAVLFAAWAQVSMEGLSRKARARRIRRMSESLARLDAMGAVVGLRSQEWTRQSARVIHEARTWWEHAKGMIGPEA